MNFKLKQLIITAFAVCAITLPMDGNIFAADKNMFHEKSQAPIDSKKTEVFSKVDKITKKPVTTKTKSSFIKIDR